MNGPWIAPRLLMMRSTLPRASGGTWSLLVIGVSLAMSHSSVARWGALAPPQPPTLAHAPAKPGRASTPHQRVRAPALVGRVLKSALRAHARQSRGAARDSSVSWLAMRSGVFFQAPEAAGQSHAERYAEMFDLVALAESLGFDVAWLAEIHFGGAFSLLSNPLMVVPAIAAAHPPHPHRHRRDPAAAAPPAGCAEQAATADLLSGGRLEFGVGRGSIPTQFHGFRVPVAENRARFDEALEIIRLAWTQERFSYPGAFYQVENLSRGAAAAAAAAPADPRGRAHAGELRPRRRPRAAHLLRHHDHAPAAAPRVHGPLPRAPRRRRPRVAATTRWR